MKTTLLPFRFAALLIATAFLSVNASAQAVDHGDKNFIENAAKAGVEEVDISQVAVERSTNSQVRTFAQTLIDDHSSANAALLAIALGKGVKLPAKDMDVTNKWRKKDGKGFDEEYIDKMVSDHKDAVELFQKEANKGEDAETKAFARATLPKLQHHLEMALDLKKMLK